MSACSEIEKIALTHRGFVREVNEDRHYVKCLNEQTLLMAVVDGMGGGPAGSAAAEIMREALTEYPGRRRRTPTRPWPNCLLKRDA